MTLSPAQLRALPKVSLHCHLTGSVPAETAVRLARKYGVQLPDGRGADTLYDHPSYEDLGHFLAVYDVVGSCIRSVEDFEQVTHEVLGIAASHGVVYREMFVSPASHAHADYPTLLDGVLRGIRAAETDFGIVTRIVPAIHREHPAREAEALVEEVVAHRVDEVLGIGLDYEELVGPPHPFVGAYALARRAGLHRTAHSESGPPSVIPFLLDELGCERIDHGYHVVQDPAVLRRCVDEAVPFTCTPVSSDIGRYSGSGDGTHGVIRQMVDAGVVVTIDSDDPPMFGTDPTKDFAELQRALGYGAAEFARFTENAIAASWADASERESLRRLVAERAAAALA